MNSNELSERYPNQNGPQETEGPGAARTATGAKGLQQKPPPSEPEHLSPAAERMRLHCERRRKGLRCLTIEVRETEIDALVRMALLKPEMRNDPSAISEAIYEYFDRTLGSTP